MTTRAARRRTWTVVTRIDDDVDDERRCINRQSKVREANIAMFN